MCTSRLLKSNMAYVPLEIVVVSADVLRKPNFFNRPRAYVVVSLTGDSVRNRQRTPVDEYGGEKPHWDFTMRFEVERSKLQRNSALLVFQLRRCRRTIGDKDIGSVYVPVKELFDDAGGMCCERPVAFPVSSRSGKPKGVVYLMYVFGERPNPLSPNYCLAIPTSSRLLYTSETATSALGQRDNINRGISEQKIPRLSDEATVGGGERVEVYPVPSAPPCPAPSAPYLPIGGYFPVSSTTSSAHSIQEDFGSFTLG